MYGSMKNNSIWNLFGRLLILEMWKVIEQALEQDQFLEPSCDSVWEMVSS